MQIPCPECHKTFFAQAAALGRTGRCAWCGATFVFAHPGGAAAPDPVASATMSLPVDPSYGADAAATLPGSAMSTGPRSGPVPELPPEEAGELPSRFGRFEVRAWVGEGSFAEVYRAYDPQLDREVALKVARPGTLGTPRRVKRFLREAKAAGNLRHPNIVPLYETGEDGGRHFLVAAFIRGRTLGAAIEEAREAGGVPDPRKAARVARKLAAALAYAHAEGVVHRDLKPDNVMVDEKGEPLLMDFGLAARAEAGDGEERLTQAGVVVGTPAYMAPEQARADSAAVGPAADQYALGCTLYELLTGRTPFTGPPQIQILLHQTEDPARPSRHNPTVPRDLDAICLKCLAKEPAERYPSAADLADDLDRFHRGEPVQARRHTPLYLAGKFVRRYRRALAITATVLLCAVLGTTAAFVRIAAARADAEAASRQAQEDREKAEADRARAEAERAKAQRAKDETAAAYEALTRKSEEARVVGQVIEEASASVQDDQVRHLRGLGPTHEELAELRLRSYHRLAEVAPGDATLLRRLARGHYVLGSIQSYVGRLDQATRHLAKAAELYEALEKYEPNDRAHRVLRCRALNELGYAYSSVELHAEARPHLTRTLALAEEGLKAAGDAPDLLYELAQASNRLGDVTPAATEKDRKVELFARARDTYTRLIEADHRPGDCHLGRAVAGYNHFLQSPEAGDNRAFAAALDRFSADTAAALKYHPESPFVLRVRVFDQLDRGALAERAGLTERAGEYFDEAVRLARALVDDAPQFGRVAGMLPEALARQAKFLQRRKQIARARAAHEEAVRLSAGQAERFYDRPEFARTLLYYRGEFAEFLATSGVIPDPVARAEEVLRARDQSVADGRKFAARFPKNPRLNEKFVEVLLDRIRLDLEAKAAETARPLADELVDVVKTRMLATGSPEVMSDDLIRGLLNAAEVYEECGRPAAVIALRPLVVALAPRATPNGLDFACNVLNTCATLQAKDAPDEAIGTCRQVIDLAGPVVEKQPWNWFLRNKLMVANRTLADIHRKRGDHEQEVQALREQLRVWYEPYTPVRGEPYLRPGRPATKEEADEIRAEIRQRAGKMKNFTVACDFNGVKYPVFIYITDVKPPRRPLDDQARWLKEVRGGTIPPELVSAIATLHKTAHEKQLAFEDLLQYTLGLVAEQAAAELKIDPGTAGRATPKLAALTARAVALKNKLGDATTDRAALAELARLYLEVADQCNAEKLRADAVAAFEGGARAAELALAADPRSRPGAELLARTLRGLARTCAQANRLDAAIVAQLRFVELADRLARWPGPAAPPPKDGAATDWAAERTTGWVTLGEMFNLHHQRLDATRWFLKGIEAGSDDAARKFARLAKEFPAAVDVAPDEIRVAFEEARTDAPTGEKLVANFVKALAAARAAKPRP